MVRSFCIREDGVAHRLSRNPDTPALFSGKIPAAIARKCGGMLRVELKKLYHLRRSTA
jgi:hypothetical protein